MNAKDYEAEMKWLSSSKAKQCGAAAKAQAFSEFKKHFPRAGISRFIAQVDFDPNRKANGRVLFPDGDGSWENPLIGDRKYWFKKSQSSSGNASRRWLSNAIDPVQTKTNTNANPRC